MPNDKVLEKQIRAELNILKMQDPERAKDFEKFVFERNEFDDIIMKDYDLSEVKYYPGTEKGPLPSDDPEGYSKWFVEN